MLGKCTIFLIPQHNHANEGGRLQSNDAQVNEIIEVEPVTGWRDAQVEGDHVDPAVLLTPNEDENDEDDVGLEEPNIEGDLDEGDQVNESVFGL